MQVSVETSNQPSQNASASPIRNFINESFSITIWLWRVLLDTIFYSPLRTLYLKGPQIGPYGFWQGKPLADICATLTPTSALFWLTNMAECERIVEERMDSMIIVVSVSLQFFILYRVTTGFFTWWFFWRPWIKQLQQHQQHNINPQAQCHLCDSFMNRIRDTSSPSNDDDNKTLSPISRFLRRLSHK